MIPKCCPNSNFAKKVNNFKKIIKNKVEEIRKQRESAKNSQLSIIDSKRIDTNQSKRFLQTESMHDGSSSVMGLYANNAPIQTKNKNKVYPNTDCETSGALELMRNKSSTTPIGFDSDAETKVRSGKTNEYKRFSLQPVAEANIADESKYTIIDPAISIDSSKPPAVPDVTGLTKE